LPGYYPASVIMRAIHVLPSVLPYSGGPSYSVPRLCESLAECGVEVSLHTLTPRPGWRMKGVPHHAHPTPWGATKLGLSGSLFTELRKAANSVDVIHSHNLWMAPNLYPAMTHGRRRLVVSPRGTLAPAAFAYSRLTKLACWFMGQGAAVCFADCVHATAESELNELRELGIRAPIAVIPNGVDLPTLAGREQRGKQKQVLFLSRIHPKKGLDLLLPAWVRLQDSFPEWNLKIGGPDEGYSSDLKRLAGILGCKRTVFAGALFGEQKRYAIDETDVFVLPTRSENFGIVVAEALGAQLPVVTTKGTPWIDLDARGCGRCVDITVDGIEGGLRSLMSMSDEERLSMGRVGRQWMERDFTWDQVGKKMAQLYRWLVDGGELPPFVSR
jgi:glycosyltransferase involved in cell wall biosynthesis